MRTDSHCHGKHGRHRNRNASNEQHQEVVNAIPVGTPLDRPHDDDLNNDSNGDGNDTEIPDGGQHLLEMTHVIGRVHQVRSLAKEGVHTGSNNNSLNLSLFAGRS